MMHFFSLRLCVFASFLFLHAHAGDTLTYDDQAFLPTLKTIRYHNCVQPPLVHMGIPEHLVLTFDELNGEKRLLKYTLLHCTAAWQPSGLQPGEYLEGPVESEVTQSDYSKGTTQPYVHYSIRLPGPLTPKISGNYLVLVY